MGPSSGSRPHQGKITVFISCLSVIFLAAIQFSFLADLTLKETKLSLEDAPTIPQLNVTKPTAPFSFSACLIIKDDSIILPEWLAYHYTQLPLGRLIVGVDALSHTDPTPILDAYKKIGMDITVWKNDSFWKDGPQGYAKKEFAITNNTSYDDLRRRKRYRQNIFYEACLNQLHKEKRTWTMLIDVDEYLALNYHEDGEEISPNTTRSQFNQSSSPATLAEVVSHWDIDPKLPCVTFARYIFVSTEKGSKELPQQLHVHDDFNTTLFHTLRYRNRVSLSSPQTGKSIIDATRYDGSPVPNPHRIPNLCTGSNAFPNNKIMPFRVHHYVGSWEAFRSPGFDPRGRSYFDKRNNVKTTVEDNTMVSWLSEFTKLIGSKERAIEITQKLRLQAELEMDRKILDQFLQQQFDWEKLNKKTAYWE